jgi:hypothetical protein
LWHWRGLRHATLLITPPPICTRPHAWPTPAWLVPLPLGVELPGAPAGNGAHAPPAHGRWLRGQSRSELQAISRQTGMFKKPGRQTKPAGQSEFLKQKASAVSTETAARKVATNRVKTVRAVNIISRSPDSIRIAQFIWQRPNKKGSQPSWPGGWRALTLPTRSSGGSLDYEALKWPGPASLDDLV